jgi:hypothetical protein
MASKNVESAMDSGLIRNGKDHIFRFGCLFAIFVRLDASTYLLKRSFIASCVH